MSNIMKSNAQISPMVWCRHGTTGASPASLVTSPVARRPDWTPVIDELLRWQSQGNDLFDTDDIPSEESLETAIDWACDCQEDDQPIPQSITPSGNGRVTFQWLGGTRVVTIEVCGAGAAEWTEFDRGRLILQKPIERTPITRRAQLRR